MTDRSPADVTRDELRAHSSHRFYLYPGTEVRVADVRGEGDRLNLTVEINNLEIAGDAQRLLEFARLLESVVQQTVDNPDRVGPSEFNYEVPLRFPRPGFSGILP